MKRFIIAVCLSCMLLGCGIKPGAVDPPDGGKDAQQFPRTYPDPRTDPQPERP